MNNQFNPHKPDEQLPFEKSQLSLEQLFTYESDLFLVEELKGENNFLFSFELQTGQITKS